MTAENQRQEISSVRSAIKGESSSQSPSQGNVHGKDLVTRIFGDPEALSMLQEAIFFEASSRSSSDARVLKAHHEASEITAPTSKRPRGTEPLEQNYTLALIALIHHWAETVDEDDGCVRSLVTDYRKAFDLIDHNTLCTKLQGIGLKPSTLNWISDFLKRRLQRVKLSPRIFSNWKQVNAGSRKGLN